MTERHRFSRNATRRLASRRVLMVAAACGALLSASGCGVLLFAGGAAAGAGAIAYVKGRLESNEDVPLDTAKTAVRAALRDRNLTIVKHSEEPGRSAEFVAEDADGTKVRIDIERLTDRATEVQIRVSLLGDETRSRTILETIRKHYGPG
jgi:hypothetical protein